MNFLKSKIIFGDCLDIFPLISDNSIDIICTDLPYGKTRNPFDKIIPPKKFWPHLWRISKKNTAIILFGQDKFTAMMMLSDPNHRYNIIFEKTSITGHLNANKMPLRCHEDIMLFYKKSPPYHPQKTSGHPRKVSTIKHRRNTKLSTNYGEYIPNSYDSTERYPRSVWKYKSDKQKLSLHPNQKPVKLIEDLLKTYSDPGGIVLDFASGSGTTGEACFNLEKDFILIEKDSKHFKIGQKRIINLFQDRNIDHNHLSFFEYSDNFNTNKTT
jgi:site-specific DNA-methyltransferase (adenine-specific)